MCTLNVQFFQMNKRVATSKDVERKTAQLINAQVCGLLLHLCPLLLYTLCLAACYRITPGENQEIRWSEKKKNSNNNNILNILGYLKKKKNSSLLRKFLLCIPNDIWINALIIQNKKKCCNETTILSSRKMWTYFIFGSRFKEKLCIQKTRKEKRIAAFHVFTEGNKK